MADVVLRANPAVYELSANTPDFPISEWIHNPPSLRTLIDAGVEAKYFKLNNADPALATDVVEMTQAEKDAVDANQSATETLERRLLALSVDHQTEDGVVIRALIELMNKRDNYLVNRINQLQDVLIAMKGVTGSGLAAKMQDEIPGRGSLLATATRTRSEAITDFRNDVNAGNQDA